ncbi:MAG: porin family protein [Bauldia sp.]|nr:porin family protein [Bauldia sp.]
MIGLAAAAVAFAATGAGAAPSGPFSGFHLGAVLGGGWSETTWDAGPEGIGGDNLGLGGFPAAGLTTGVISGARAGYTFQAGAFAFGIEGMFVGTNVDGQIECGTDQPFLYGYICVTDLAGLATMTARAGVTRGNTFLYGTGGVAWAFQRHEVQEPYFGVISWGVAAETARGWTLGAGIEQRLSHGFSLRADYSFVRIGPHEVVLDSPFFADSPMTLTQNYHFASIGFDFRFGGTTATQPPENPGGWAFEAGTRTWAGVSRFAWDLYHPYVAGEQLSRIDFQGPLLAGEAFLRAANGGRLFVNALFGTGATIGGTLIDDDYPPFTDPFSQTLSVLGNGRTTHASVDVGLTLGEGERWAAGAFAGVGALLERYAAFGCEQLAGGAPCAVTIPAFVPVITQTSIWGTLRVGVIGQVSLTDRLWLRGEATAIPLAFFASEDNHWLRPDINPLPLLGRGYGIELQATLTYEVNETFSIGVGTRFGQLVAPGTAYFPGIEEPQTTTSRRSGVFLQMSHTFGG